ncbi:hypothetical protein [Thermofilum sp.]|uniref:hypothetical protein n=1 Tax=Thermofilum sp. TaxID=1961369 RepID=UPI00316877A2
MDIVECELEICIPKEQRGEISASILAEAKLRREHAALLGDDAARDLMVSLRGRISAALTELIHKALDSSPWNWTIESRLETPVCRELCAGIRVPFFHLFIHSQSPCRDPEEAFRSLWEAFEETIGGKRLKYPLGGDRYAIPDC